MKLGKKPFVANDKDLLFSSYRTAAPLPEHPRIFGHEQLVKVPWGMLANDRVGCCTVADGAHETMLYNAERGVTVAFDDDGVISDYSAITGYVPGDPSTDNGAVLRDVLDYRRMTGLVDAKGDRHKIAAFVRVENLSQLFEGLWLFGSASIGVQLPQSAETQFGEGKPWSLVNGSPILGGHAIAGAALRSAGYLAGILDFLPLASLLDLVVVTWGKLQPCTMAFSETYIDEMWISLSAETLDNGGKSLEGFDLTQLRSDLAAL